MRILALAPGERSADWSAFFASWDPASSRSLKSECGTTVLRVDAPTRSLICKRWLLGSFADRFKAGLGQSRAHRHWRGARTLAALDIATAVPFALARSRDALWLAMPALSGPALIECLARPILTPRREHILARNIARQLVTLTLAGRYNRDHKPSNLIVLDAESPDPRPAIIDTVAINKLRFWRPADLYAMFASLVIEPLGCSCPPRRALMMRVLVEHQRELLRRIPNMLPDDPAIRRAARHRDWMRIAGLIDAHGDPTPRIDPLARA